MLHLTFTLLISASLLYILIDHFDVSPKKGFFKKLFACDFCLSHWTTGFAALLVILLNWSSTGQLMWQLLPISLLTVPLLIQILKQTLKVCLHFPLFLRMPAIPETPIAKSDTPASQQQGAQVFPEHLSTYVDQLKAKGYKLSIGKSENGAPNIQILHIPEEQKAALEFIKQLESESHTNLNEWEAALLQRFQDKIAKTKEADCTACAKRNVYNELSDAYALAYKENVLNKKDHSD
jgi:hypothetical protein